MISLGEQREAIAQGIPLGHGRAATLATYGALLLVCGLSASGLFLENAHLRIGPGMSGTDVLRVLHVGLLVLGLTVSTFRYAKKHHSRLDELVLLTFLACGVNLIVQLSGGPRSYWQGLYLLLGGLASVAFTRGLVVSLVGLVLFLETANWLATPDSSPVDLFRLALLFLLAVVGYNYMERAERERADRAEDRLLRLDAGLRQLGDDSMLEETGDEVSPLSEEGQRAGRAEQVQRLETHLEPLLALAAKATDARSAVLLQVAKGGERYWVRMVTTGAGEPVTRQLKIRGSLLAEALRTERPVVFQSGDEEGFRAPWWRDAAPVPSVLAVPIRIWDEPPWVLVLEHHMAGHFGPDQRAMALAVAQQMTEAQALFRRETQHYVEELELKGLLGASEKLSTSARLVELLRHMVDYSREVGKFETCAVCLVSEGKEEFSVVVAEGYRRELLGKSFPMESPTWAGWVLRAREEPLAIRMERRSGMAIVDPKERPTTGASFLAVPLRAQQRVCGALLLTRSEAFTARELRLLRIYCNQAAVAVENAIVYEQVENLAATDALTGLYNRRYLEQALARELSRAERTSSSLALLMLDIDHFKGFNDSYGHAMGDVVLKKVATTLGKTLRKADVLARFGGEEFVVLLPNVTPDGAADSAERIRARVEKAKLHPGGPRKRVTVSVGLAMYPDHAVQKDDLLKAADRALYRAKESGRNRVCHYEAQPH